MQIWKQKKWLKKRSKLILLTLKLVIIRIDDLQIFLGDTSSALILIEPKDTLQEFHHFLLVLMPHRRTGIDPGYVIATFYSRRGRS